MRNIKVQENLTPSMVLELIRKKMEDFPYHTVYFKMREYGVKNLLPPTVETVRCCLAVDRVGLNITSVLLTKLTGRPRDGILPILHKLGDKHVLVLIRRHKRKPNRLSVLSTYANLHWLLHPTFAKKFLEA